MPQIGAAIWGHHMMSQTGAAIWGHHMMSQTGAAIILLQIVPNYLGSSLTKRPLNKNRLLVSSSLQSAPVKSLTANALPVIK